MLKPWRRNSEALLLSKFANMSLRARLLSIKFYKNLLILTVGFLLGWTAFTLFADKEVSDDIPRQIRGGKYSFINPLLECELGYRISEQKLFSFKSRVQQLVDKIIEEKDAEYISVYYRNLDNGPWFGINEREPFKPASLLKVPLLITYMKIAEKNPKILDEKIVYNERKNTNVQYFKPSQEIELGKEYTVAQLIEKMIIYSDNNAANLLRSHIDSDAFTKAYKDLGIEIPDSDEYNVTVKTYASFFRILYNSSYLNEDSSEFVLRLLNMTEFSDFLAGGVPQGVRVSHKFGEFSNGTQKQLHDCGIIYHPKQNYLLCIMSRGSRYESLSSVIREISSAVYGEVDGSY